MTQSYHIAVIGGDGTGPEVTAEAVKVLEAVAKKSTCTFLFKYLPYNGTRYLETGHCLSDEECQGLTKYDAILLGAIGHPEVKPGILEKQILLKMRFDLDQYINLRPIKLYPNVASPLKNATPQTLDYVVVRENTGGLYTGKGAFEHHDTPQEVATQHMIYSYKQVERCVRFAFEYARKRHHKTPWRGLTQEEIQAGIKGKVTLCGKTNVLTYVFDLWERVFYAVAADFPDLKADYVHVDAVCIYMVDDPGRFDVVVTSNMFGDIITDLGAITQGGLGVAPGANINPQGVAMFEPIGGTAPDFTGKNTINPIAAIGAAALMLDHLGLYNEASWIEQAITATIATMPSQKAGEMGCGTTEIGDRVAYTILADG